MAALAPAALVLAGIPRRRQHRGASIAIVSAERLTKGLVTELHISSDKAKEQIGILEKDTGELCVDKPADES